MNKLTIGWFTFTCCEDSTMLMIELLNNHWQEWTKRLDFRYVKALRKYGALGSMDVAFVEGAISSDEQAQKLKKIRKLSKKLIAIGACAVIGQPAAQRNDFDPARLEEIKPVMERFSYSKNVQKLSDLVKVDHSVSGCPMDEQKFLDLISRLITNK